jgi:hypothetical protein
MTRRQDIFWFWGSSASEIRAETEQIQRKEEGPSKAANVLELVEDCGLASWAWWKNGGCGDSSTLIVPISSLSSLYLLDNGDMMVNAR